MTLKVCIFSKGKTAAMHIWRAHCPLFLPLEAASINSNSVDRESNGTSAVYGYHVLIMLQTDRRKLMYFEVLYEA